MDNISEMILINVSRNHDVLENVFTGANYTHEEICIFTECFKEFCDVFTW